MKEEIYFQGTVREFARHLKNAEFVLDIPLSKSIETKTCPLCGRDSDVYEENNCWHCRYCNIDFGRIKSMLDIEVYQGGGLHENHLYCPECKTKCMSFIHISGNSSAQFICPKCKIYLKFRGYKLNQVLCHSYSRFRFEKEHEHFYRKVAGMRICQKCGQWEDTADIKPKAKKAKEPKKLGMLWQV